MQVGPDSDTFGYDLPPGVIVIASGTFYCRFSHRLERCVLYRVGNTVFRQRNDDRGTVASGYVGRDPLSTLDHALRTALRLCQQR